MAGIFISYRRSDAGGWAGRFSDSLRAELGRATIFRDIDNIPPGVEFDAFIAESVSSCDVLVALIGPTWLTASESGKRRLDNRNDFTRIEIATALQRKIRVVPVLVGNAQMPSADGLPDDLKPLARRQAYELTDRRWTDDCRNLAEVLRPIVHMGSWRRFSPRVAAAIAVSLVAVVVLGGYGIRVWYDSRATESARRDVDKRALPIATPEPRPPLASVQPNAPASVAPESRPTPPSAAAPKRPEAPPPPQVGSIAVAPKKVEARTPLEPGRIVGGQPAGLFYYMDLMAPASRRVDTRTWLFLPENRVSRFDPSGGGGLFDPSRCSGDTCGRYLIEGALLSVIWDGGRADHWVFAASAKGISIDGRLYRPARAMTAASLVGQWSDVTSNIYTFNSDGQFSFGTSQSALKGTYRLQGLTLTLTFADGDVRQRALFALFAVSPEESVGLISVAGSIHARRGIDWNFSRNSRAG